MHSSKFIIYVLAALIASVAAAPHGKRGTCRRPHHTVTVVPNPTSAAATVSTPAVVPSTTKPASSSAPQVAPSATTKPAASTTKAASTTTKGSDDDDAAPTSTTKGASTTKSSASAAPTSPSTGGGGALSNLFPAGRGSMSWTVAPSDSNALPLNDNTLRPEKVMRSVPHSYTKAPDGKTAMRATYPKGSYTFGHSPQGGFSFYAPGPSAVDLTRAKEATFGYSVYMPSGFDPVLGGKLPGLYGGNSDSQATSCSGGRRDDACFSVRLMWRSGAEGELYTYLPPSFGANKAVCNVAPSSDCNPTYGASVGRGSFHFTKGGWTTVSERVRLNDVGKSNGEIQLFVNGKSVINVSGLVLRNSAAGRIRGMQFQTFFGGSKPQFASTKNQELFFSDFSLAVTQTL